MSKNVQIHLGATVYSCSERRVMFSCVYGLSLTHTKNKKTFSSLSSCKIIDYQTQVLCWICMLLSPETGHHFHTHTMSFSTASPIFTLYIPKLGPLKLLLLFICAFCMYVLFVCAFPHTCILLSLFFCSSQPVIAILWGPLAKPVTKPQANALVKTVWRVSHATVVLKATSRADHPLPPA